MKKWIILLIYLLSACASGPDSRARSPQWTGSAFENPWPDGEKLNFFDFFSMRLSTDYAVWPVRVENPPLEIDFSETSDQEIKFTWINQSTMLIQWQGKNILIDPLWSERTSPFSFIGPQRVREPALPIKDLPPIHLILISHDHYDHLDLDALEQLQERFHPQIMVGLGLKDYLLDRGMARVQELDWWEFAQFTKQIKIHFLPAKHFSARWPWDRNQRLWGGFWIQLGEKSIYYAGDTGMAPVFQEIKDRLGSPDLCLLPIGAYKPRDFMRPYHINPAEAVRAHQILGAKVSIGVHRETIQLSQEAFDRPVKDLRIAMEEGGLASHEFLAPPLGKTIKF